MSLQKQFRRDSHTNLMLATPAAGEPGQDTTNNRMVLGDGVKAGGHPQGSWKDIQNSAFISGTVGGTANAITITFTPQLLTAALAAYQRLLFIATNTNTGSTTLQVTDGTISRTAKTIKKVDAGAKAILAAGDIVSGLTYEVVYDGTDYVILGLAASGIVDAAAGDYIIDSSHHGDLAAGGSAPGTSPVKVWEFKVARAGTYRLRQRLYRSNAVSGTVYGQIYVNGGTSGTLHSRPLSTPAFFSDDITVNAEDLIQWYCYASTVSVELNALIDVAIMESIPLVAGSEYTLDGTWT